MEVAEEWAEEMEMGVVNVVGMGCSIVELAHSLPSLPGGGEWRSQERNVIE